MTQTTITSANYPTMIHPEKLNTTSCASSCAADTAVVVPKRAAQALHVRFSEKLVTAERERPRTAPEDLSKLFFTDVEIEFFKRRFQIQQHNDMRSRLHNRRHRRLIRFADEIVTDTHVIPKIADKDISRFFFTEDELDEILDEILEEYSSEFTLEGTLKRPCIK